MKNDEKVMVALITGLTVGALLGVLFAPHKGSKTRRILNEEGNKMMDTLREKFDEGIGIVHELKDEIFNSVSDTSEDLNNKT